MKVLSLARYRSFLFITMQNAVTSQYVICLSVCLSVTFRYAFHTGWNTLKIISWPNSLRHPLTLTPKWAIWSNGNTPKLGWNRGGVRSTKTCNISRSRLLWWTNRKSHTWFRLVPKSVTLDDLERVKRHSCRNKQNLRSPTKKCQQKQTYIVAGKM